MRQTQQTRLMAVMCYLVAAHDHAQLDEPALAQVFADKARNALAEVMAEEFGVTPLTVTNRVEAELARIGLGRPVPLAAGRGAVQ